MRILISLMTLLLTSTRVFALETPHSDTNFNGSKWTLADVERLAFDRNPDLKSAQANFQATSKTVMESISGYLPHVDLNAGISETNLPSPSAAASAQVGIKLSYGSVVASITQTLFDFGKVLSQINANRALTSSAEQSAIAVKNAVSVATEKAFYEVIAEQKLLDASYRSLEQFKETYRTTSVLVRTGVRPSFDLTQANVQLAKAKLGVIYAQEQLDLSKITLLNLLGFHQQEEFELIEPTTYDPLSPASLDLNDLTAKALVYRPEVKSSDFSIEEARLKLHGQMMEYLPTLSLNGFYGSYQPNYPTAIRTAWSAGVGLTWNLFDGLNTSSRVGEYEFRLDQKEAEQQREKNDVVAEVARSYKNLIRAQSQLEVADDALASAQENSQLANKRYKVAVATILELLVAESSLAEAEGAAIQAKYERQIALTQLKEAVNAPLLPIMHLKQE